MEKGAQKVAFYFAGHQDDWQLFMNPAAFYDVLDTDTKAVFIHMTAGDAGLGANTGGRKYPYYAARENGVEHAIRFMADSTNRPPVEKEVSAPAFNGRRIRQINYRNTTAYFLRLPDGGTDGNGYPATGHQSLRRLARGDIQTLQAIDGSSTYTSWSDLTAMLRSIIDRERELASAIYLHVPEHDAKFNPGDHPDHYMTAQAALDATRDLSAHRVHYLGYSSTKLSENLNARDRDMKCAVYAVTVAGILAFDHPNAWQHYDECFAGRSYFRLT